MIKLTDKKIDGDGYFYTKISAEQTAYNGVNSCLFYETDFGFASLIDGVLTVAGKCDLPELCEFMRFTGANTLLCEEDTAPSGHEKLFIMSAPPLQNGCEDIISAEAPAVHNALSYGFDGDIEKREYIPFALDYSLRCRRGCAFGYVDDDSVCVASAVTDKAFIISGVAVKKTSRGKGKATDAVMKIRSKLSGKTAYLLCRKGLVGFYEKCGFKVTGYAAQWRM